MEDLENRKEPIGLSPANSPEPEEPSQCPEKKPKAATPVGEGSGKRSSDVYQDITATIVSSLEKGVKPWCKPWDAEHAAGPISRPLRHDGTPYRGINVVMLWAAASSQGVSAPIWLTYRQASYLGGHVRKGEKGTRVVFANTFAKTEEDDSGDKREVNIPYMKGYTVFNVEQVDGLPGHFYAEKNSTPLDPETRHAQADQFFEGTGVVVKQGGNRAFYSPSSDHIQMPNFRSFADSEGYAATLAHELTHWTGHESRLDRKFGTHGSELYAKEELVAELASAFLCADLELAPVVRPDHASYVASWLKVLKNDKRALFRAASDAQKAVDYLHGLQQETLDLTVSSMPADFRRTEMVKRKKRSEEKSPGESDQESSQ